VNLRDCFSPQWLPTTPGDHLEDIDLIEARFLSARFLPIARFRDDYGLHQLRIHGRR